MKHRTKGLARPCSAWDIYHDGAGLSCSNCGAYEGAPQPAEVLQQAIDKASTHLRLVQAEIHAAWPMDVDKRDKFYRTQVDAAIKALQEFLEIAP